MSAPTPPTPTPIEVNFEVVITGDSAISIFSAPTVAVTNVIVAEVGLPVNALYDEAAVEGLIELWEPLTGPNEIECQLANVAPRAGAYKKSAKKLALGLERILCGSFDCAAATPFNDAKYATDAAHYRKQRDFGRVALSSFSHFLLGHVDATAAITNDLAFIKSMLSLSADADAAVKTEYNYDNTKLFKAQAAATEGARLRNAKYSKATEIASSDYTAWTSAAPATAAGTAADANLAQRLVAAILAKGLSAGVESVNAVAAGATHIGGIVAQVVGQDASRLMNVDNNARTKETHQFLRFYAGDIIYMNIKLAQPSVTVGTGQKVLDNVLESQYSVEQNYTLKITLEEADTTFVVTV